MLELDKIYYEWLGHRCLYYKHNVNILSDQEYDMFERLVHERLGDLEMVDWDRRYSRTANRIDRLSQEEVYKQTKQLLEERLNGVKK